ncbi:hypothetical protein [Winogradskyella ursingii]|uniref:hypothetical protein n=1 Tax=Winogradskyella ursingii TaxID=2686079 RepID=UPI0015CD038F|nr:hypothetical protein [Winogradskyella ursingii]
MKLEQIQSRIQNAKDLDFGDIFNSSIELFKKVWVQGLVTILLNMVLAIPVMMIIYIPLLLSGVMTSFNSYDSYNTYNSYDQYTQSEMSPILIGVMVILYIFFAVAMGAISFGLKAAFYRICKFKDLEQMGREDYFYFFKKPYLKKTILISLALTGIALLAVLLCFLPLLYAIVPLSFMVVIFAFNPNMPISDIIKLSFELGNKKWLITFGLLFVSGLLAGIVGMLMCFVGIYVTSSFSYLPTYVIYREIIGFEDENQSLQIEENTTI